MSNEKKTKKVFENLDSETNFLIGCMILECCLTGILFKLVLGRTDWYYLVFNTIAPSFIGTVIGIADKEIDDKEFKEIKLCNPFRERRWLYLIVWSISLSIIEIFITGVLLNMQWSIFALTVFITTWVAYCVAYVLLPIWNS